MPGAGGANTYLEVVSLDRDSEIRSVKAAIELDVDYLLGGTHAQDVLPLLEGTAIRYYPFPGRVVGHPSILEGSETEIVKNAVALASHPGVAGLDLLAYRSAGNVPSLMEAVCRAVPKPVIVAGSVDGPDQIEIIRRSGAAGFTVGTSALDGRFPAESTALDCQLRAISACRKGHLESVGGFVLVKMTHELNSARRGSQRSRMLQARVLCHYIRSHQTARANERN